MPDDSQSGEKIVTTVRTFVARSLAPIEARVADLEKAWTLRPLPETGERGADGSNGRDGVDGKDGAPGERGADGKDGRDGVDGKNGDRGADGRSITPEEITALIEPLLALKFAAYVVEHERRLPDVLQRMIDKLEKPTDGRDGKDGKDGRDGKDGVDGADGFDLRHFDVTQTDERTFTLRFKDLRREVKHPITLPVPIERGIWKADRTYVRGDLVTWGGSGWVKQTDEPGGKPEESAHWRLFVKRGRDGKDGEKGDKGDTGKAGRNGRDLTQLGHDGSKW